MHYSAFSGIGPYTCIYIHWLGQDMYTSIYMHVHAYTDIYINIHAYTYIYRHQRIAVRRCFWEGAADALAPLDGRQPTRPAVTGSGTGFSCVDRAWETSMRNERAPPGAMDACHGVGCANLGLHKRCLGRKKVDAQMPRGALSVANRLSPLETVFRGRGIDSSVLGCHFRKYMHIHTKYDHIHHKHIYTCIYIHIHTYTNFQAVDAMHVY